MDISSLPNIGKTLAEKLNNVGINSSEELISLGSEKSFVMIRTKYDDACIYMLMALEGAIQGIRWHSISKARKEELKFYFSKM